MADRYDDRYGSDPYTSGRGFARDDRNILERAGEEVRSWFGGEDRHRGEHYRRERPFRRDERDYPERAGDEVRSWFGDEEAARRRRMDEQERERQQTMHRYGHEAGPEYGRYDYGWASERSGPDWTPDRWERTDRWSGERRVDSPSPGASRAWHERDDRYFPPADYTSWSRQGWGAEAEARRRGESRGIYEDDRGRVYQFEHGTGNFAGRGPKGYTRSDERIREDVCERLTADPRVDATDVEVVVNNGEVTLSGLVNSRGQKRHAEDLVEDISGVRDVHNDLRVGRWDDTARTGTTAAATPPTTAAPVGAGRR